MVKDDSSVLGAIAYYTALTTSPKNINSYCEIVFRLIHQQGFTSDKKETYFFAAKTAKLNMTEFYRHWGDEQVMSMFTNAAHLSSTYQIQLANRGCRWTVCYFTRNGLRQHGVVYSIGQRGSFKASTRITTP